MGQDKITNNKCNVTGILLLIFSVLIFGIMGMPKEMTIGVAAGFLIIIISDIDKFSKIKGFGITAALDKKIERADKILEKIETTTSSFAIYSMAQLAFQNRWNDGQRIMTNTETDALDSNHDIFDEICITVKAAEIKNEKFENYKTSYLNNCAWDMVIELYNVVAGDPARKLIEDRSPTVTPSLEGIEKIEPHSVSPDNDEYMEAKRRERDEKVEIIKSFYDKYDLEY